ncbi:hypothetical protein E1262_28560 [Jiangella aurantiaca]|uniref:DUF4333 domain-containing protein n=1 Tax=Jiangella aurantiaca TaxID=2530373 RepID=A0A4R5A1J4_9ACTN|nr:hypothetical protein [Jiangella aurantiaca]TDD64369.1 hypothetical protein E1262_28560 [Jiangella aurantiaca]
MRRILRPVVMLAAGVLALTACSEQLDQGINDLAASALEDAVTRQLSDAGVTLESGPDCTTDLNRDGTSLTGDANCSGTAVDGRSVRAEFDGTLSSSGCSGSLGVFVDDEAIAQLDEIPDCSVNVEF